MSKLIFAVRAWDEYLYWQTMDRKTLKRINQLLKDIARENGGIGKPEPLRHHKGWSRRIDNVNRLVYTIQADGSIEILQCKGHYDD